MRPKPNPIAGFRIAKIFAPHITAACECHFAQTANRTKMFHVKHFGPVEGQDRTKRIGETQ
jgi:hypothetical protein